MPERVPHADVRPRPIALAAKGDLAVTRARLAIPLLAGVIVILVVCLAAVFDRVIDYRDEIRRKDSSFLNEGLRLTSTEAIRAAGLHPLGVFVGGSLVRYWYLPTDLPFPVVNRGGLEERIAVTRDRFSDTVVAAGADVVLINPGFCDLQADLASGRAVEPSVERHFRTLREIVDLAERNRVRPILTTLPPVRPKLFLAHWSLLDWAGVGKTKENRAIVEYNRRIAELCAAKGIALLDFHRVLSNGRGELVRKYAALDGEHLNGAGYGVLGRTLRSQLEKVVAATERNER